MPDHILDAAYSSYHRRMSIAIPILYRRWLIVQALQAPLCDIPSSLSLWALLFQRTPHIEIMASTLQLAIEDIQFNNYVTRMLVELGASRLLILAFFQL